MKLSLPVCLLVFLGSLLFSFNLIAQQKGGPGTIKSVLGKQGNAFEIKSISLNQETRTLDFELNAVQNNQAILLDATNLIVRENHKGQELDLSDNISEIKPLDKVEVEEKDKVSILFLIDLSGSMRGEKVAQAKEAILTTVKSGTVSKRANLFLASFHDDIMPSETTSVPINQGNVEKVVNEMVYIDPPGKGKETDLYRAIIRKVDEFGKLPGKKAIIILSDGENSIRTGRGKWNPVYDPALPGAIKPYEQKDVYDKISEADSTMLVFPIGLGDGVDENFLSTLPKMTKDTVDVYSFTKTPTELSGIFSSLVSEFAANYLVKINPPKKRAVYSGNTRTLTVVWKDKKQEHSKTFQFGTPNSPLDLRATPKPKPLYWLTVFLGGLIGVFGLLAILMLLVPWVRRKTFTKKYVKPYVQQEKLRKKDPITLEPFEEGEMIVDCCKVMMAYDSWEHNGNQCVNYPGCLNDPTPCSGKGGNTGHEKFFSQKGLYRSLNWFWFGGFGGLLAWMVYAMYQNISIGALQSMFEGFVNIGGVKSFLAEQGALDSVLKNLKTLTYQVIDGIGLGLGLCFSLAMVEEMGQARKVSVLRILMRMLLGGLMAFLVFMGGFFLQYLYIPNSYLAGLIAWTVFGLLIGWILSIRSTISGWRGLVGGIVAGLVSFQLYYFVTNLDYSLWPISKLISFILLGGILGLIIVAVVSSYEDFELEYVEPAKYRRVNPISKWLKAGMDIFIGRDQSCYVYVHWEDPIVQPQHATLSYDKKKNLVYVEPHFETLLNNKLLPVSKKTELQDGDLLQFGRTSVSRMRFKVKTKSGHAPTPTRPSGGTPPRSSGLFKKKRQKPQIKITRRT